MNWTAEISAAGSRIGDYVRRTPVVVLDGLGVDCRVAVKLEQVQHTGTFKVRGAFNTMLAGESPGHGYVAASGGNHGAAVAHAARALGRHAHIFVPELAGPTKISLIRSTGAELTVVPGAYADAQHAAETHERQTAAAQIHAYDAPMTIAGQGTCFREWEEQGLDADTVLVAVGGGGLIAGALAWFGDRRRVVAVEPEHACTLNAALESGPETEVDVSGIAVNSLGARRIGRICYSLAIDRLAASVTVSDSCIASAQVMLWKACRQLVEPAGATALAALVSGAYRPAPGERVAVLVCGANPDPDPFA